MSRIMGQVFVAFAIFCAAVLVAIVMLESTNDCTMNWYGYDCPDHYRWLAAAGPVAFVVAPVSLLLGAVLMWAGRKG